MDNDDNLFDESIDGDDDLLDISLDDLTTEDFEKPAPEEPDEEVIELIDLVEKSDGDIDEEIIDFDDTKPLTPSKGLAEKLKLAAAEAKDDGESEEIGNTASISRSDLELGDITLETGIPDLNEDMEKEEMPGPDTSDVDIDLDTSEKISDFEETADFLNGGLDKSPDAGDTVDKLADTDTADIITGEVSDPDESVEELFKEDDEILVETDDDFNETVTKPLDTEDSTDGILKETAPEEKSIDISDKPVEADTGQLNETVVTPLPKEEELLAGLEEKDDLTDQQADEKAQLSDINLREEPSHEEDDAESAVDSSLMAEGDTEAAGKEISDVVPQDKIEGPPYSAPPAVVPDERIEEAVTKVVGEVVEKVAREVFTEVAEKIISEAIDGLKKSLEADSE